MERGKISLMKKLNECSSTMLRLYNQLTHRAIKILDPALRNTSCNPIISWTSHKLTKLHLRAGCEFSKEGDFSG